jgi:F-type H+-transporting ATPase subunit delta
MARQLSAKRYAQAIFDIAREKDELEQWLADLKQVAGLAADGRTVAWLESARTEADLKNQLLQARLGDISPLAMNLVNLLLSRGNLAAIVAIIGAYEVLLNRHRGLEIATVTSAVALDDTAEAAIRKQLGAITGKDIQIETKIDPAVLGGFIAKIGDRVIDGSAAHRLEALKFELGRRR